MPTPRKPAAIIEIENKSHRTKEEMRKRKAAEESTLTHKEFKERKEVKENPIAHKEFARVKKLLKTINKNDALYEPVINRYCLLQAECVELEERREEFAQLIRDLNQAGKETELEGMEKASFLLELSKELGKLAGQVNGCDKLLGQKRKMLLDIEKENIMTIAAALRTVPTKTETGKNPLLEALGM